MRTWKIVTIAIFAVAVAALTTTSVFAYMGRPGFYTPHTISTGTQGTYGSCLSGTARFGGYYGEMMRGGRGCGSIGALYGYGTPPYSNPTTA